MGAAVKMSRFNQIKYFDQLKESGFKEDQAKAILNLVNDANDFNINNLVTKDHLDLRLAEFEKRFTEFELKMIRRSNVLLTSVIISILVPIVLSHFGLR